MRLYWGDSVDVTFTLPDGMSEQEVVESTISVTGYYERYSALMARLEVPAPGARSRRAASMLPSGESVRPALACPVPARRSPRFSAAPL